MHNHIIIHVHTFTHLLDWFVYILLQSATIIHRCPTSVYAFVSDCQKKKPIFSPLLFKCEMVNKTPISRYDCKGCSRAAQRRTLDFSKLTATTAEFSIVFIASSAHVTRTVQPLAAALASDRSSFLLAADITAVASPSRRSSWHLFHGTRTYNTFNLHVLGFYIYALI